MSEPKKKSGLADALARVKAAKTSPDGAERDPESEDVRPAGKPKKATS